jgi:pantothenate synthetase
VRPDVAVFGQKDYQQFRLIEQMVYEFNHPLQLVMTPIIRDFDGLTLSSRNRYLNPKERTRVLALYEAIKIPTWITSNVATLFDNCFTIHKVRDPKVLVNEVSDNY